MQAHKIFGAIAELIGSDRDKGDDQTNDHKPMENHDGVTVGRQASLVKQR